MENAQLLFAQRLKAFEPCPWEQIPDLGLYMDQVITYMERQWRPLLTKEGERVLTPSMVNNYVKMGLVDRPMDKKYGRDQLAQLFMVSFLKQSATAEEIRRLLKIPKGGTVRQVYEAFLQAQSEIFVEIAAGLPLPDPMHAALRAAGYRLLFTAVIEDGAPKTAGKGEENEHGKQKT